MISKITYAEETTLFDDITEFSIDSIQEHRRGSNFYREDIIEFKPEHKKYFEEIENFEQYIGTWKTNTILDDWEHGSDESFSELVRVEKKRGGIL